jgi:acetyl-CoA acyltransferase
MSSTLYKDLMAVDLGKLALAGLIHRNPELDPAKIDYLLYGTVIQESRTSNIAREAAMAAGIPLNVPAHTIAQACISANQAICTGVEKILAGRAEIIVAGGCETFSDLPIRFSKSIRQRLIAFPKASKKGPMGVLGLLRGMSMKDLSPETPAIANYTTGEVMGHSSDRLAGRFGISRADQDAFAVRSHLSAYRAHVDGLYKQEIIPFEGNTEENGIKKDSSIEKLSKLSPAFVKPHGTHTAANSSFLSDGASAALITSERKAAEMGLTPRSSFKSWTFVAVDPFEDLLLGPTFGIAKVLDEVGLTLKDIDVFEIHEAFAGQVLANLAAMDSDKFAKESMGRSSKLGLIPMEKLNTLGGSLSLGHPFGATGTRLVTTATNRLHRENGRFALIAACADGGLAHAAIIERYDV